MNAPGVQSAVDQIGSGAAPVPTNDPNQVGKDAEAYYLSQGGNQAAIDAYNAVNQDPMKKVMDATNWYTDKNRTDTNTDPMQAQVMPANGGPMPTIPADVTARTNNVLGYFGYGQPPITPPPGSAASGDSRGPSGAATSPPPTTQENQPMPMPSPGGGTPLNPQSPGYRTSITGQMAGAGSSYYDAMQGRWGGKNPSGYDPYAGTGMKFDGEIPNTGAWAPGSGDPLRDPWMAPVHYGKDGKAYYQQGYGPGATPAPRPMINPQTGQPVLGPDGQPRMIQDPTPVVQNVQTPAPTPKQPIVPKTPTPPITPAPPAPAPTFRQEAKQKQKSLRKNPGSLVY